jgi:precorrin-4 methylase
MLTDVSEVRTASVIRAMSEPRARIAGYIGVQQLLAINNSLHRKIYGIKIPLGLLYSSTVYEMKITLLAHLGFRQILPIVPVVWKFNAIYI